MNQPPLGTALIIWIFLMIPGVIYFSAVCAYYGLIKAITITHFGIRSGVIAHIYGFFYLLVVIGGIFYFRFLLQTLIPISIQETIEALLYPFRMPGFISIMLIGLSVLMFFFWILITRIRSTRKLQDDQSTLFEDQKKQVLTEIGLIFLTGILSMTDVPIGLPILLLLLFGYFGTLYEIKKLKSITSA